MAALRVLFVMTSHDIIVGAGEPTGVWMEELSAPYYALLAKGCVVDFASIKGGTVPFDPRSRSSVGENPSSVDRFLHDGEAMQKAAKTFVIDALCADDYAALFLPGGHGAMWDFPKSRILASLVSDFYAQKKIISAVCHGPAGFLNAKTTSGDYLVRGKKITAFTDSEEKANGSDSLMPFLLETKLRELGVEFMTSKDFHPHAVTDGNIITGQNPASSVSIAQLIADCL